MAKINDLTSATALDGADKFLIETPLGAKSISGYILKQQVTADSLKKGVVLFDEPLGYGNASISLEAGKRYDIYTNSAFDTGGPETSILTKTSVIYSGASSSAFVVPVYQGDEDQVVLGNIFYDDNGFLSTNNPLRLKIYKIIRYEV